MQRRLQSRQEEIISGFPDALDMMLVCVEAGQSLDQSIIRVAKESRAGYPALADEFDMVAHEVKAGKERVAVLRDMSERVGIARHLVFRDHAGAIGDLRYLDRRSLACLFCRNA